MFYKSHQTLFASLCQHTDLLGLTQFPISHDHLGDLVDNRIVASTEMVGDFPLLHIREWEFVADTSVRVVKANSSCTLEVCGLNMSCFCG